MKQVTRRDFLRLGAQYGTLLGLAPVAFPKLAEAAQQLAAGTAPVLWLQGMSCSGCSVSLLNTRNPGPVELITRYINLAYHPTLSTATGEVAMDVTKKMIDSGGYVLVIEGAVPAGMPDACLLGGKPFADVAASAAKNADAVLAVGTCAACGGIPAAEHNPTGAIDVPTFLDKQGVPTKVVNLPGCPPHPDWMVGTILHLLKFGVPRLDREGRPQLFYDKLVHDQCPRFADYERQNFAESFSEDGCLFKLGCMGPKTHADCPLRDWNGGNNCIKAGAPCIGCASSEFCKSTDFPFYRIGHQEESTENRMSKS